MSNAPDEQLIIAVLLSLWRQGGADQATGGAGEPGGRGTGAALAGAGRDVPVDQLLHDIRATPAQLHQALDQLRQRRCLIERTAAAGGMESLRLVSTGLACWSDILENMAREERLRIGRRVMVFARTGSTNDIAWQSVHDPRCDGLVVVADEQSSGRGRLGHVWHSRAEQSILMSVLLRAVPDASVERLTLLAGLAVAEGIEEAFAHYRGAALGEHGGIVPRLEIKWPNDLLIRGRKVAGILVERRGEIAGSGHVVIGVGINVAQGPGDFPPELVPRAISLYEAGAMLVDRLAVAAWVVRRLDSFCAAPMGEGGWHEEGWHEEWKSRCAMLGNRIRVRTGQRVVTGRVLDVDPLRGLVVLDDAGSTAFLSAQTSTVVA